jgi:predicted ATPase
MHHSLISSHSPILLGYPAAQILSFDEGGIHEVDYEETSPAHIVRRFLNEREDVLKELLKETPSLFNV